MPPKHHHPEHHPTPSKMNYCLRSLTKSFVCLIVLTVAILYAPVLKQLSLRSKTTVLPKSFDGVWKENHILSKAEKIFVNELPGPESLALYQGDLYTGIKDGRVVKISKDRFETVTSVQNKTCASPFQRKECGRPLGTRITSLGDLYIIDGYHGLVKISLKSKEPKPEIIFPIDTKVAGVASKFLDDLVIVEEEQGTKTIYMTDASAVWELDESIYILMDLDDTGRVIKFEESTGKASVVLDKLAFPNGIEISDDNNSLLIAELTHRRILRHYLKGSKAGKTEVLIDLPGEPDNIRRSQRKKLETYWIAVVAPRTADKPFIMDRLSDKPHLRNFIIKTFYSIGSLFAKIGESFNLPSLTLKGMHMKSLAPLLKFHSSGMALEIDVKGNVITCLHSPDGSIHSLSEVREVPKEAGKRVLYLGSYFNDYLGKLILN